ncbi:MAG: hypothetical protein AMJ78_02860 [Omnitrophica WOR_2 bacterium SM23_29]|nr:MAG: hypothetical protein AMJ78_02860 [Omnitrophica WOR_2 bacterium SM23_29]
MDWGTHMVLAAKLLESSKMDPGAAIYSVIPVIDQKPAHFHRVYAHILENQPDFLDVTLELFKRPEVTKRDFRALEGFISNKLNQLERQLDEAPVNEFVKRRSIEKKIYAFQRIGEETPGFLKLLDEAKDVVGDDKVTKISTDKLAAAVSLLSHTFFDTFNNPVQIFLPTCSYCSAQWEFWSKIDYMKFRGEFYKPENIVPFRKEIAASKIWNVILKPEALMKAMIIRLGEMGQPAIPYEIVDMGVRDFLRYMNINEYQRADAELKFLYELEDEIAAIIYKKFLRSDFNE